MSAYSSLAIALFVLAAFYSPVSATDWYKVGSNPIVNIFNNQPFSTGSQNFALSGFVDYQEERNRAGFVVFIPQDPAPEDTVMAFDNGPGYYKFFSQLTQSTSYPYVARLSTVTHGDRIYAFYQNKGDAKNLWAVYTDDADYYGGPIYSFNAWSSPVLVYSNEYPDNLEQISVTSLNNQTIYVAVKYDSDDTVELISTNDFVTFTREGTLTPDNSASAVQVYDGFSIFAAHDPSNPAGPELLWFHWIETTSNAPFIAHTSAAEPRLLQTPFIQTGNPTSIFDMGVTAAANDDGSKVMLVRAGSQSITSATTLYYSIFSIDTMTFIQTETPVVGLDDSIPQTSVMPAIISSRYAGDAIKGKKLVLAWSNYADNLVYTFAGSPF